jgi:23S rRNA pseudouridine955/2504/2580 synthase
MAQRVVSPADDGQRMDRWLKRVCVGTPFVALQKAMRLRRIRLNGRQVDGDARVKAGDTVDMPDNFLSQVRKTPAFVANAADRDALASWVVYEDRQLLVLNKPQGLPAQAGGGQVRSLDRILVSVFGPDKAPKLTHRLDRETTGVIVAAKNRTTAAAVSEAFAARDMRKAYIAWVVADRLPAKGEMREPLAKVGPLAKVVTEGDPRGDTAHTLWVRLGEVKPGIYAVLVSPLTGRMNQIRAHFFHHGWPLVGDDKYGFQTAKPWGKMFGTGLALHAWRLAMRHPVTDALLQLEAPVPEAWAAVWGEPMRQAMDDAQQAWHDGFANKKTGVVAVRPLHRSR